MAVLKVCRKADKTLRRNERNLLLLYNTSFSRSSSVFFIYIFLYFPVFDFRPSDDPGGLGRGYRVRIITGGGIGGGDEVTTITGVTLHYIAHLFNI